jgi:hypothetical protein
MPKGWKALPMKAYLTDYAERIEGLHPVEALRILREIEEGVKISIRNGNTVRLYTDAEFRKDTQNELKATRRLINLQYKRLEKIYSPLNKLRKEESQ